MPPSFKYTSSILLLLLHHLDLVASPLLLLLPCVLLLVGDLAMRVRPASATSLLLAAAAAAALLLLFPLGRCQSFGGVNSPPSLTSPLLSQLNEDVNNVTRSLFPLINDRFGFCIKDASVSSWSFPLFFPLVYVHEC